MHPQTGGQCVKHRKPRRRRRRRRQQQQQRSALRHRHQLLIPISPSRTVFLLLFTAPTFVHEAVSYSSNRINSCRLNHIQKQGKFAPPILISPPSDDIFPQYTLPSIQVALRRGDYVRVELRSTNDVHWIAMPSNRLAHHTIATNDEFALNHTDKVEDMSVEDVRDLKVPCRSCRYGDVFGVPTLEDILNVTAGQQEGPGGGLYVVLPRTTTDMAASMLAETILSYPNLLSAPSEIATSSYSCNDGKIRSSGTGRKKPKLILASSEISTLSSLHTLFQNRHPNFKGEGSSSRSTSSTQQAAPPMVYLPPTCHVEETLWSYLSLAHIVHGIGVPVDCLLPKRLEPDTSHGGREKGREIVHCAKDWNLAILATTTSPSSASSSDFIEEGELSEEDVAYLQCTLGVDGIVFTDGVDTTIPNAALKSVKCSKSEYKKKMSVARSVLQSLSDGTNGVSYALVMLGAVAGLVGMVIGSIVTSICFFGAKRMKNIDHEGSDKKKFSQRRKRNSSSSSKSLSFRINDRVVEAITDGDHEAEVDCEKKIFRTRNSLSDIPAALGKSEDNAAALESRKDDDDDNERRRWPVRRRSTSRRGLLSRAKSCRSRFHISSSGDYERDTDESDEGNDDRGEKQNEEVTIEFHREAFPPRRRSSDPMGERARPGEDPDAVWKSFDMTGSGGLSSRHLGGDSEDDSSREGRRETWRNEAIQMSRRASAIQMNRRQSAIQMNWSGSAIP